MIKKCQSWKNKMYSTTKLVIKRNDEHILNWKVYMAKTNLFLVNLTYKLNK